MLTTDCGPLHDALTSHQFRSMWTEFEWENRVNVTTSMSCVFTPFVVLPPFTFGPVAILGST